MDVKNVIDRQRTSARDIARTQADKAIGEKVIELLCAGDRVSRASLLRALRSDEKRLSGRLNGLRAGFAAEAIEQAASEGRGARRG